MQRKKGLRLEGCMLRFQDLHLLQVRSLQKNWGPMCHLHCSRGYGGVDRDARKMSSQAFLAYWTIVDTVGFPYTTPSFYHFRDYQPTDSTSISFPEDFFPTRDHFAAHLADQLQGLGLNSPDPSSPQSIIKVNRSVARVPCLPE